MPVLEWDVPFEVVSPYGTLPINQDLGPSQGGGWSGRQFRLVPSQCRANRTIRASSDPVPQGDGEIHHDRFSTGYSMQLAIALWEAWPSEDGGDGRIACDEALCEMGDLLGAIFWSLLRPESDGGRVLWTPSCGAQRMVDAARLRQFSDPEEGEEGAAVITAVVDTPFPYAISAAEDVVAFSGTMTLPNDGNVDFFPVFKVNGATGAWSIENNATGELYLYDSSRPGASAIPGGSYAEIDMFRGGLIYLNGDGANLKAGVDVEASDILTVAAGGTSFTINGATADALMHDAWA